MPDTYTGTNTEKIDKLIADVIEIKTNLRNCFWLVGTSLPFLVGLNIFLVNKTYDTSGKLDRMSDKIERIEKSIEKLHEQLEKSRK